jgi:hypothetical protein
MEKGDANKREMPMLEEISRQIEGQTDYLRLGGCRWLPGPSKVVC